MCVSCSLYYTYHTGLPIVTSIFSNSQVSHSNFDYKVPAGFICNVLTCNVLGWPLATVEWLVPPLSEVNTSKSTFLSVYSILRLHFPRGFNASDFGLYYCFAESGLFSFRSNAISLMQSTKVSSCDDTLSSPCEVSLPIVLFEFRILTTDCSSYPESTRLQISTELENAFAGGILSQCQNCSIHVTIGRPNCSKHIREASFFRGVINNTEVSETQATFCAISKWWSYQPIVRINSQFWPVDPSCMVLQVDPSSTEECLGQGSLHGSTIGSLVGGTTLIVIVTCLLTSVILTRLDRERYI